MENEHDDVGCVSCEGVEQVERRMNWDTFCQGISYHLHALGPNFIFMDDNAPCHGIHKVRTWMRRQQITSMEVWPPEGPILNLIEHA